MALLWKAAVVLALTADIGRLFQRGMVRGEKENLYSRLFAFNSLGFVIYLERIALE